jgi:hypothetical protein
MYRKGMNTRLLIFTVVAFVAGPWMIWSGFRDYQNKNRLGSEGLTTSAQVLDKSTKRRSRGADRYFLSVHYRTEAGQELRQSVQVFRSEYERTSPASTVTVRYLPSEPGISAIGEVVPTWRRSWISGSLLLLSGCVLAGISVRTRLKLSTAAEKIAEHAKTLCETRYEYASVKASEFSQLDLAWYDSIQRWLEERGFTLLGDEENLTFRRTSKGIRTLLRTMTARDGAWLAYVYHFKPPGKFGDGFKILELQTQFADSTFLGTSNAEAAGKLDSPPGVDALRMPATSSFEQILEAHTRRFEAALASNPANQAVQLRTLDDVHRSQNVLQGMRAAYRQNKGISREELDRMGGAKLFPEQVTELHAQAEKIRVEQQQRAA